MQGLIRIDICTSVYLSDGAMSEKQWVRVARALADPTRLSLFRTIAEQGEMSCGALAERFPVAQSTVSHHLNVLINAGLVEMRKQGQHHLFRVCAQPLREFCQQMQQLLAQATASQSPVAPCEETLESD
jgi:ArsR family transcriptional regulator